MYNLPEYNKNYRKTTGSNPLSSSSESFKYQTSITGNTYNINATIACDDGNQIPNPNYVAAKVSKNETKILLKHLSNLWRTLNMPLINCEIELILAWLSKCVQAMCFANNPSTGLEFQIEETKLYVLVVILPKENKKKLLEQLKSGSKTTIKGNKYRSQMTIQS